MCVHECVSVYVCVQVCETVCTCLLVSVHMCVSECVVSVMCYVCVEGSGHLGMVGPHVCGNYDPEKAVPCHGLCFLSSMRGR